MKDKEEILINTGSDIESDLMFKELLDTGKYKSAPKEITFSIKFLIGLMMLLASFYFIVEQFL